MRAPKPDVIRPTGLSVAIVVATNSRTRRTVIEPPEAIRGPSDRVVDCARIGEVAIKVATSRGEPNPTNVVWVETTRRTVAAFLDFGLPAGDDGATSQVLIAMQGHFRRGSRPGGASKPAGTTLIVVMNHDFSISDLSVSNRDAATLSTCGHVHRFQCPLP